MICCFREDAEGPPLLELVALKDGFNLNKLGLLADAVDELYDKKLDLEGVKDRLKEIEAAPDPFGPFLLFVGYIMVGAGLPVLLQGSWWDVVFATVATVPVFLLTMLLERMKFAKLIPLLTSFVAAAFAAGVRYTQNSVSVVLVTLSAIAIQLPGYGISLGTAETLILDYTTSGISRVVQSFLVFFWLVLGGWLGTELIYAIWGQPSSPFVHEKVPLIWQALFAPMVMTGLTICFQNSYRDIPWGVLNMGVAYASSYFSGEASNGNLGTFVGSAAMTITASIWSRWKGRPMFIVLGPSIVFMVSGTSGFRGIVDLSITGATEAGHEQVVKMFIVALLVCAGVMGGMFLVPPKSIL